MKKPYERIRIEPISCWRGTAAGGGAVGSTIGGGVVDITNGIGDLSIIVGAQSQLGTASVMTLNSGTAVNNIKFSVYEGTAATHAGSAISGATLSLGCATAGVMRGLLDAFVVVSSLLTTAQTLTINGIVYHTATTGPGRDGSAVSAEYVAAINGSAALQKLPHYKAHSTGGGFMGATSMFYITADDDEATGLTITMSAVTDTAVPYWNKVQGKIDINAHALSTCTPKFLSVRNATFAGNTAVVYSYLVRGGRTPGALTAINT